MNSLIYFRTHLWVSSSFIGLVVDAFSSFSPAMPSSSGASIGFYRAAVNYSPTIPFPPPRNLRTLEILISQFPLNRYGTLFVGTSLNCRD